MEQHGLATNIDAGVTTSSPANERVVCIVNQHFQTLTSDIRKLFSNLRVVDQVRGLRSIDEDHGPSSIHYVLFASARDRERAVSEAPHYMRGFNVVIEAASTGAYQLKIDQSGFCKRLEKNSHNLHQADPSPGPRNDFIHGPSPLGQSCTSRADSDNPPGLSALSAAQKIRHGRFYLEDLEKQYTQTPTLETEIHTPKNHYDKAPCVFGDRNHRESGWNVFLQKQESQRATDFERKFRLREAECKKASYAAISSSRLKTIFYSVDPVVQPTGQWNLRGKSANDPKHNIITQEQWYSFSLKQNHKGAENMTKTDSVAARIIRESGMCDGE